MGDRVSSQESADWCVEIKIKYDPEAKAVYIYLVDTAGVDTAGIVDHTQELTDMVVVDWTKDGELFGIDVLGVDEKPLVEGYND